MILHRLAQILHRNFNLGIDSDSSMTVFGDSESSSLAFGLELAFHLKQLQGVLTIDITGSLFSISPQKPPLQGSFSPILRLQTWPIVR